MGKINKCFKCVSKAAQCAVKAKPMFDVTEKGKYTERDRPLVHKTVNTSTEVNNGLWKNVQ